jgi:hypothetical protein
MPSNGGEEKLAIPLLVPQQLKAFAAFVRVDLFLAAFLQ